MSTDPLLLYTGSYAAAAQPGIQAFTFDPDSGGLTACASFAGVTNPSYLTVHPNGRWLYAVSETSAQQDGAPGAVWALRVSRDPWRIERLNQQASGGNWPCHLLIDPTGRWLLVTNYASGSVGVLPIGEDGALGVQTTLIQHHGRGPHPDRQEGPHAHSSVFAPDGRFVIVADLGSDALVVYAFDPSTGGLQVHAQTATRPGAGPRHMAFHPRGQALYVANELDNTVAVYDYAAAGAPLHERQTLDTVPPGAPESTVADLHLTPAGDRVYVSNRGHDSIAVFDIAADGLLSAVAIVPCGGRWPRNFALAPGERWLLVANQYSDALTVLPLLQGPAPIGAPAAQVPVPGAACVQFAPTL